MYHKIVLYRASWKIHTGELKFPSNERPITEPLKSVEAPTPIGNNNNAL